MQSYQHTSRTHESQRAIGQFTAGSGTIRVRNDCDTGYNAFAKGEIGSGSPNHCSDRVVASDYLVATLPSDSAGTTAEAQYVGPEPGEQVVGASLPVRIDPGHSITLDVTVNGLIQQGTYALKFGLSIDGKAPMSVAPSDGPVLIAPNTMIWKGINCQSPSMLAQIPAAAQDIWYTCPPAS